MVMPRAFSSGEESISSYFLAAPPNFFDRMVVIAAVSVVLPWSTCPMVPTFTCGLVLSNFSLLIVLLLVPAHAGDDFVADGPGDRRVLGELHGVGGAPLGARAEVGGIAEHLRQRHLRVN